MGAIRLSLCDAVLESSSLFGARVNNESVASRLVELARRTAFGMSADVTMSSTQLEAPNGVPSWSFCYIFAGLS